MVIKGENLKGWWHSNTIAQESINGGQYDNTV